ncbi:MAG: hypothetical protein WAS28_11230 [Saprospiraceae bacterium]
MYRIGFITLCAFLFVSLFSCKKESAQDDGLSTTVNLSEYTVEDIPGSNRKMLTKMTTQGLLEEQGMVEGDKKVGTWAQFYAPNTKPKEIWTYENGKLNGLHYLLNNSGRVDMYESFLDGKLHGKRVTYKQGSPVEEMSYKNGQLDGIFRGFFPTGKLQRIGNFVNGKQDGKYIVYDENKQIILQANYRNGEVIK